MRRGSAIDSLDDHERSVLLIEILRAHPDLRAEAEEFADTILVADYRRVEEEVAGKLRSLRVDTCDSQAQVAEASLVAEVARPYLDDIVRRARLGARRAAVAIGLGVMFSAYECREDTDNGLVLVRLGLPDAADQLARTVYQTLKAEHLSLPSLRDECPEWDWYEESWS